VSAAWASRVEEFKAGQHAGWAIEKVSGKTLRAPVVLYMNLCSGTAKDCPEVQLSRLFQCPECKDLVKSVDGLEVGCKVQLDKRVEELRAHAFVSSTGDDGSINYGRSAAASLRTFLLEAKQMQTFV
jgi:hypothetical protein